MSLDILQKQDFYLFLNFFLFLFFNFVYLFIYLFIYLERGRVLQGGAERKGERILSRCHTVSTESDVGLNLTNRETMT